MLFCLSHPHHTLLLLLGIREVIQYAVEEPWGVIANMLGLDFEGEGYGKDTYDTIDKLMVSLRAKKLIDLNNKRKIIEQNILDEIDFKKIMNENKYIFF